MEHYSQDVKDHLAHVEYLLTKIDNLPLCNVPMSDEFKEKYGLAKKEEYSTSYSNSDSNEYKLLCEELEGLIGADCWAVIANGEELFNNYKDHERFITDTSFFKNSIIAHTIRKALYKNIHLSILMHFNESNKVNTLDIYMFQTDSWKVHVEYDPTAKKYKVSCFTSSATDGKSLLSTT